MILSRLLGKIQFCRKPGYCFCRAYILMGLYPNSFCNIIFQSATAYDSLVGVFCYKPFDAKVDWSIVAKASPCYMTVCYQF